MATKSLHQPPFPDLYWSDDFWEGNVLLPSWKGFQVRGGAYGSVSSKSSSDGNVRLSVAPINMKRKAPPTSEQTHAFQLLLANEKKVAAAVIKRIFDEYPKLQRMYGYQGSEAAEYMPPITRQSDLKRLIGLSIVHLLTIAKDGCAYVGFELGCTWDPEHGLGVMTHQSRVVQVGGADTSFLDWIAEEDADPDTEEEE